MLGQFESHRLRHVKQVEEWQAMPGSADYDVLTLRQCCVGGLKVMASGANS